LLGTRKTSPLAGLRPTMFRLFVLKQLYKESWLYLMFHKTHYHIVDELYYHTIKMW
jgi:hypothetical protein